MFGAVLGGGADTDILRSLLALLDRGFNVSGQFAWTGYKSMKNRDVLIDAICRVYDNPAYKPKKDARGNLTTFCNFAVRDICGSMVCHDFAGLIADQIYDLLVQSSGWQEIRMNQAQAKANQGSLVVAAARSTQLKKAHGHVCVIRPGLEQDSGKWGKVPSCINIGADNFIGKGICWAFSVQPKIFVWKKSL